ncbi:MAG: DUF1697 domain-containing protein [Methanobacterium sp.]
MVSYVALLRGIGPSNPNMRNENLKRVFEDLGFKNVRTVISSGNVLFETQSGDVKSLEALVEKTLPEQLDFRSTTIIRSKEELEYLFNINPFKNIKDTPESKLNVTFLKNKPEIGVEFPFHAENQGFVVLGIFHGALCSIVNTKRSKTPVLMRWLEKEFGREITTRTWKTVNRILQKLNET